MDVDVGARINRLPFFTNFPRILIIVSYCFQMKKRNISRFFSAMKAVGMIMLLSSCNKGPAPISLHPENPHYFLFRGQPTILIGSTEHYGAVLNLDFDYVDYLDELAAADLNVTRTFSGIYSEPAGAFGISENTLAPAKGKLICPWARSNEPGYANGGNKFDLNKWDPAYFSRLKDFIGEAGKRNIVVELDLFSNFYDTLQWKLSPLYFQNNINRIGNLEDQKEILSLRHPDILEVQEKMVRKIIAELRDLDNLYYEVCNEPYFGDTAALEEWEQHMTSVIAEAEKGFARKHLISQNIANGYSKVKEPHPAVSIFNFHYAKPPVTVGMNYGLNKVIGDNETGFNGISDVQYRTEAWDFFVAGGALFNNLDYSFTTNHEKGTFKVEKGQPGGGGISLRLQFKILRQVLSEVNFLKMRPNDSILQYAFAKPSTARALISEGNQYLIYINNKKADNDSLDRDEKSVAISVNLPKGDYSAKWINTLTGERFPFVIKQHEGGMYNLKSPRFTEDIALMIKKKVTGDW